MSTLILEHVVDVADVRGPATDADSIDSPKLLETSVMSNMLSLNKIIPPIMTCLEHHFTDQSSV